MCFQTSPHGISIQAADERDKVFHNFNSLLALKNEDDPKMGWAMPDAVQYIKTWIQRSGKPDERDEPLTTLDDFSVASADAADPRQLDRPLDGTTTITLAEAAKEGREIEEGMIVAGQGIPSGAIVHKVNRKDQTQQTERRRAVVAIALH